MSEKKRVPSRLRPYASDADAPEGPSPAVQADAMGATVIAYLVTGPALFGGLGWLLATWLDLRVLTPIGVVAGMGLSLYTIWLRYGRTQHPTAGSAKPGLLNTTPPRRHP